MKFSYEGKEWFLKPADINSPYVNQLAGIHHLAAKTGQPFSYYTDRILAVGISASLTIASTSEFNLVLIGGEIEGVKTVALSPRKAKVPWKIARDYHEAGMQSQRKKEQEAILSRRGEPLPTDHTGKCKNLVALCDLFKVPVLDFTVWGSCPVANVDMHPFWEIGSIGKLGHIIQFGNYFTTDFNPTFLGIPSNKKFGVEEYIVEI